MRTRQVKPRLTHPTSDLQLWMDSQLDVEHRTRLQIIQITRSFNQHSYAKLNTYLLHYTVMIKTETWYMKNYQSINRKTIAPNDSTLKTPYYLIACRCRGQGSLKQDAWAYVPYIYVGMQVCRNSQCRDPMLMAPVYYLSRAFLLLLFSTFGFYTDVCL